MKDNQQLAQEYKVCAENLKARIDTLKTELTQAKTDSSIFQINRRIRMLQYEYYDCVKIARYLENEKIATTLENGLWPASKNIYKPTKKPKYLS